MILHPWQFRADKLLTLAVSPCDDILLQQQTPIIISCIKNNTGHHDE